MRRITRYYLDGLPVNAPPKGFGAGTKTLEAETAALRIVRIDYQCQNASPRKRERLARAGVPLS